jgi:Histidine kinase-like ATPase domain
MGCSDRCVTDATIAVTEAVTNAVRHGYEDGQPGELRLSVSQVDAEVVLSIEDDGRGPGPNLARHGTGGGLGIPLMAELARLLTVRGSKDTGTTVTLSFPCPTARWPTLGFEDVQSRVVTNTQQRERGTVATASTRDRGIAGIGLGGILVIVGIVLAIVWSAWIGIIIALVGLVAFGGFVKGRWYWMQTWYLRVKTLNEEREIELGPSEGDARAALEDAKRLMAETGAVTIAGALVVNASDIESLSLRKG